jgi:putative flippase GtrA
VAVSAGVSALTQVVLAGLIVFGWRASVANLVAVSVGTGASFSASRRYVWAGRAGRNWWVQVVPFWTQSFAGLVLSTAAVSFAASHHGTGLPVTAASLGAWALIWPAGYLLNDLFVFAAGGAAAGVPAASGEPEALVTAAAPETEGNDEAGAYLDALARVVHAPRAEPVEVG